MDKQTALKALDTLLHWVRPEIDVSKTLFVDAVAALAELSKSDEVGCDPEDMKFQRDETCRLLNEQIDKTKEARAQAEALAQALNKIDELEQGTCYSTMQGELADQLALRYSMRRAGEIAREASASYRAGNPPRKSVPLAMLEEMAHKIKHDGGLILWEANEILARHGYEVTE